MRIMYTRVVLQKACGPITCLNIFSEQKNDDVKRSLEHARRVRYFMIILKKLEWKALCVCVCVCVCVHIKNVHHSFRVHHLLKTNESNCSC